MRLKLYCHISVVKHFAFKLHPKKPSGEQSPFFWIRKTRPKNSFQLLLQKKSKKSRFFKNKFDTRSIKDFGLNLVYKPLWWSAVALLGQECTLSLSITQSALVYLVLGCNKPSMHCNISVVARIDNGNADYGNISVVVCLALGSTQRQCWLFLALQCRYLSISTQRDWHTVVKTAGRCWKWSKKAEEKTIDRNFSSLYTRHENNDFFSFFFLCTISTQVCVYIYIYIYAHTMFIYIYIYIYIYMIIIYVIV